MSPKRSSFVDLGNDRIQATQHGDHVGEIVHIGECRSTSRHRHAEVRPWLGTSASVLALVVLCLCERAYRRSERQAFRLVLFPLAAVVATTGFFGGALLYGIDHYGW